MHKHSPSWFMLSSKATAHIRCNALVPAVVFTFVALCVVCLRWYSRAVSKAGGLRMEDWLVNVAMALSIGITGAVGGELHLDNENDLNGLAQSKLSTVLKLVFCQSIFYHLSINLVKASFALQYLRLFFHVRPVVYACYILLLLILGAAAWGVFGVVFLCRPVQSYWDITASGKCINAEDHFFTTSIIGIVLDWAVWMLPIPVVGRLKLPHRQRVGLLFVFGLGGVVCIVTILRLVLVHHFAHRGQVTKSGTFTLIWSTVEINVAIICASLLVMKPLFARFIPALVSEQPLSAREDARIWRGLTGLHLLEGGSLVDEEKQEEDRRRDTAISMGERSARRIALPARARDQEGRASVRWSW
ncbi:hypothetical protein FB567DRAFT_634614 [Paraphoma chrysanthemicola]|uniref:Rhodopsin domain-containing protein n=1 Tax=Paraphoma chrysanthemicola TaxID=798071 RepID=A0A8K0VS77_9PLEO|nr:hypothetical protein FB567DRAFT_634614 [Paraphoma chrysanthemicola]